MEGEGQGLEDVHFLQFVVFPHVVEECLLVADEVVLLKVVMDE